MKIPCKKCLILPMCMNKSTVRTSGVKCVLLRDYITNEERAEEVIRFLKPDWYIKNPSHLECEAENLPMNVKFWRLKNNEPTM